jgi:hypothetical protein
MRFELTSPGSFSNTELFLRKMQRLSLRQIVEPYAQAGVAALAAATPADTGQAASSWGYEITESRGKLEIHWTNSDIENGYPVAVMIQYGHGTGTGGYVQGIDYINPALRPIFDQIAEDVWRVVNST